jgi:hypothetical protein
MLFFRSEERVRQWCDANGSPVRPLVSLAQLWGLSVAWYRTRLQPPAEMRAIFAGLGLAGGFWDPQSDAFG